MSRDAPPPLPGGYKVGDKVFYTGAGYTFANGDKVVHGQQGEGVATLETHKGKGVAVRFPGNKDSIECYTTSVRISPRSPRQPLPQSPRPHCMSSRCSPLPGSGRDSVWDWTLRWQRH